MSVKDTKGNGLAVGDKIKTVREITVPNKGSIPAGTVLTVDAFGRTANHVDVKFEGKTWYVDGASVEKA